MIIWRCDQCGTEVVGKQTVGHEFDYLKHNFGSLAAPVNGKRDLCSACMSKAQAAFSAGERSAAMMAWDRVRAALTAA